MNKSLNFSRLRLFIAKTWHNMNYLRYKARQKKLMEEVKGYIDELSCSKNEYNFPLPLNALSGERFMDDAEWREIYKDLGFTDDQVCNRKRWEFTHTIYGFEKLGVIGEDKTLLGIASGHERIVYYLANYCKSVIATDIYEGSFTIGEDASADPSVLSEPDKFAPFEYRKDHLEFVRMNALDLKFPENTFDAAFCLCAIEHFGGKREYQRAAKEISRVLKPGGIAAITTEFSLNNKEYRGYFTFKNIEEDIIKPSGLTVVEPFDFYLDPEALLKIRLLPKEEKIMPHFILQMGNVVFTSISIFLRKPEKEFQV